MAVRSARRDARAAVIATVAFVSCVALLPLGALPALLLAWLAVATVGALAGVAPLRLARRAGIALPFALAALPVVFTRGDELLWSGALGPISASISGAGLRIVATAAIKAWISVQASLLLVERHSIESIAGSLRRLRLPEALATGIGLTVRYLSLLRDEATRMIRARAARSASPVAGTPGGRIGGTIAWRARTTGNLAGALFLRAYARATRVEEAAAARGATGSLSIGMPPEADPRLVPKLIGTALGAATLLLLGAILPRL
ncbi:MAG: cobalt transporter component CbiQ [Chloroflexota bacterium]